MLSIGVHPSDLTLRFVLHADSPPTARRKWKTLRSLLHTDFRARECDDERQQQKRQQFVSDWVQHCTLESNRLLPFLNRVECGIGNTNNSTSKQLRFKKFYSYEMIRTPDDTIVINQILNGDDGTGEQWNASELADLMNAFCRSASILVGSPGANCVNGYMEVHIDHRDNEP